VTNPLTGGKKKKKVGGSARGGDPTEGERSLTSFLHLKGRREVGGKKSD